MKRMLLAVTSAPLREILTEELSAMYQLCVCTDGNEALEAAYSFAPELMVLDLMLPETDGITLLRTLRAARMDTTVLVLTAHLNDYIAATLEQLQVAYIMRIPCSGSHIVARVLELERWNDSRADTGPEPEAMLASLGFRVNSASFRTTVLALECLLEDPCQRITTQLYPAVARRTGTTAMQVERSIRIGIESAWKHCNLQQWRALFPLGRNGKPEKPSNSEFLYRICAYILSERQDGLARVN